MSRLSLPCLQRDGLDIFTVTPDQRLKLGEAWFEATHLPITAKKFIPDKASVEVHESQLLRKLSNTHHSNGNNVFILFGAAGSGKSELMLWLETQLKNESNRVVVRITRTELDIFSTVGKLQFLLSGEYFEETTQRRWEEMKRKPRTLTKILVLRALENLVDSDDLINALYYRLVDIVTPQIQQLLNHELYTDLLPRDIFETTKQDSVLQFPFDFELFRQSLVDGFRTVMLEGISIKETLSQISQHFESRGLRPVMLIDDLVQSINLFATEFLDYFITLEQGNWDVVIGVTPASFQYDARGRELLERITYLDTIDDRVDKLWLSDEKGINSSFLNESNCTEFVFTYLQAFRKYNELECHRCPALQKCSQLKQQKYILSPFNEAAIIRIFRGLPNGKGKLRALIRSIGQILERIIEGENPENVIADFGQSEVAVDTHDPRLQQLIKWYLPFENDRLDGLLAFFEVEPAPVKIKRLSSKVPAVSQEQHKIQSMETIEPAQSAIRDWLENTQPNRQLLHSLRKGVVYWLRAVRPVGYFYYPNIARPSRILRDQKTEMSLFPPIQLEDIDIYDGIPVSRSIGHTAFLLEQFGENTGKTAQKIGQTICDDNSIAFLLWKAEDHHDTRLSTLEQQLGLTAANLAIHLFIILRTVNGENVKTPPGIAALLLHEIAVTHQQIRYHLEPVKQILENSLCKFLEDFFKLRDNLVDGWRIHQATEYLTLDQTMQTLLRINTDNLSDDYRLGNTPLSTVILKVQLIIQQIYLVLNLDSSQDLDHLSKAAQDLVTQLMKRPSIPMETFSQEIWQEIETQAPDFYRRIRVMMTAKGA